MTTTTTKTRTCGDCGVTWTGNRFDHLCRTADLPRAKRRDGDYAMRPAIGGGWAMWVDVPDRKKNGEFAGTSYVVGAVMDPENFSYAVDEAKNEAREMWEQARKEFGF